jgi:hypothetical protein
MAMNVPNVNEVPFLNAVEMSPLIAVILVRQAREHYRRADEMGGNGPKFVAHVHRPATNRRRQAIDLDRRLSIGKPPLRSKSLIGVKRLPATPD